VQQKQLRRLETRRLPDLNECQPLYEQPAIKILSPGRCIEDRFQGKREAPVNERFLQPQRHGVAGTTYLKL
jgi:hypothetical protein